MGILAFELLVGEAPFYHEDEKETVKLIQSVSSWPAFLLRRHLAVQG